MIKGLSLDTVDFLRNSIQVLKILKVFRMAKIVEDNEANMAVCRDFCGPCPMFKPNELQKFEPHALFCARGESKKPKDQIKKGSCNCFSCPIFEKHELSDGYFCLKGISK